MTAFHLVDEQDLGWLAGFFDGEGCVSRKGKGQAHGIRIDFINTEENLIRKAQGILDALEIDNTIQNRSLSQGRFGRKAQFCLHIGGSTGIRHFFAKVPIQSQEKLDKYKTLISFLPTKTKSHTRSTRQRLARQYPQLV